MGARVVSVCAVDPGSLLFASGAIHAYTKL